MTIVGSLSVVVLSSLIAMWLNDNFNFGGSIDDGIADS